MQKVYTKIESIVGDVITVRAQGVRYQDLAMVGKGGLPVQVEHVGVNHALPHAVQVLRHHVHRSNLFLLGNPRRRRKAGGNRLPLGRILPVDQIAGLNRVHIVRDFDYHPVISDINLHLAQSPR